LINLPHKKHAGQNSYLSFNAALFSIHFYQSALLSLSTVCTLRSAVP